MAIISKGIPGGFSGTVGTVIGGNWNGIDYMRSLPTISNKSASQAQIEPRNMGTGTRSHKAVPHACASKERGMAPVS